MQDTEFLPRWQSVLVSKLAMIITKKPTLANSVAPQPAYKREAFAIPENKNEKSKFFQFTEPENPYVIRGISLYLIGAWSFHQLFHLHSNPHTRNPPCEGFLLPDKLLTLYLTPLEY